jgi:cytochrome c oxidase cbb3-type subunit 3
VAAADLQTGNAEKGREYFQGAGGCTACHSPTGDFAGVAKRLEGLTLLQRMLFPGRRANEQPARPATATITLRSGETVTGTLAYRDEFTIAVTDASGWHRSWPASAVKYTVNDPLDAHRDQIKKYTDEDMHNVLAYLQTLR